MTEFVDPSNAMHGFVVRNKSDSDCIAMTLLAAHETGHMTAYKMTFSLKAGHLFTAPVQIHWWPKYGSILVPRTLADEQNVMSGQR